ncbi:MAG: ethanolamine utilization protein EutN [Candidatus Solibacter sp.]|nr:ethanolamine utilization protein EutN [Candidatus Solibacter sp.]
MLIAKVIGDITSTQKHPTHEGRKLLLVQPLELDGRDRGVPMVAVDSVSAGVGDRVLLVLDGFAAFTAAGHKQAPIDAAVIGVIDHIELVQSLSERAGSAAGPLTPSKKAKKQG